METAEHILTRLGTTAKDLTADSRKAGPGVVFAAYPGTRQDGRDFISSAIARNVDGILWEKKGYAWDPAWSLPNAGVDDLKSRVGEVASQIYGQPSEHLHMIGVTGTNGKTSVTHWIAQCLNWLGRKAALLGTLGNGFPGGLSASANTTPDAIELQQSLALYLKQGARACAMEVSSHGLDQDRAAGCKFNVAVLTNLSRDHLDYHGDMDAYAAAKARLFHWTGLETAVLNLDDEFGQRLAKEIHGPKVVGYGFGRGTVVGELLQADRSGMRMAIWSSHGKAELTTPLVGRFNASNVLAVLTTLLVSDVPVDKACDALAHIVPPPGRMQTMGGGAQPLVVIDYAHTPDALEKVLASLRKICAQGRLICVFGCGGNRDKGKRPLMGKAASQGADSVIVTSDNPRNEDPMAIIDEITPGMDSGYKVEPDRARAIFEAIGLAHAEDVVLVAGKGHEDYQEINGERRPFSDVDAAIKALEAWS
ncbi:MAG: UDP-N-acetylmuramoyl-L-alanyl-D-glutamate--2,6-diaminopimelate ligase [Thiobacillaceae bacterium]|jgi:UDP-N-acetylmuramoyl-L-alanyl-D-glutamate--2,6-diaminopimelate ligase